MKENIPFIYTYKADFTLNKSITEKHDLVSVNAWLDKKSLGVFHYFKKFSELKGLPELTKISWTMYPDGNSGTIEIESNTLLTKRQLDIIGERLTELTYMDIGARISEEFPPEDYYVEDVYSFVPVY